MTTTMTTKGMRGKAGINNDRASAGGLAGLFILFLVCSVFIVFLGPVVDKMNDTNNDMIGMPGLPVSQERMDTMGMLMGAFAAMSFVIVLAGGINYWIVSIRAQNAEV